MNTDLVSFKIMKTTLEMVKNDSIVRITDAIQTLKDEFQKTIDSWIKTEDFNWKMGNKANQHYVEDSVERWINISRSENEELFIKLEEFKGEVGRKILDLTLLEEFDKFK